MKIISIILISIGFAGCVVQSVPSNKTTTLLNDVRQVRKGMTVQEVQAVMPQNIIIGYEIEATTGEFQQITAANPYRVEEVNIKNETYKVVYYIMQINQSDDMIADDELMPFVFKEDRLIGKGWNFLFNLRNR